jgi:hypothetical protein
MRYNSESMNWSHLQICSRWFGILMLGIEAKVEPLTPRTAADPGGPGDRAPHTDAVSRLMS